MALLDDINRLLRDHTGYTGDGQGGSGPLPVGDRSTARFPINKRDLRELLISIAQAMGDPEALQEILDQVEGKADIANSGKVFNTRAAAVNAGQEVLPGTLGLIATREGDYIVYRAPGLTADDPLFATAPRWGVMLRVPSATLLDGKADLANSGSFFTSRTAMVSAGQSDLPGAKSLAFHRDGDYLIVRSFSAEADDPLFATSPRWGVMLRVPDAAVSMIPRSAIPNGTNLNTISAPGVYQLNADGSYVNAPPLSAGKAYWLTVTLAGTGASNVVRQAVDVMIPDPANGDREGWARRLNASNPSPTLDVWYPTAPVQVLGPSAAIGRGRSTAAQTPDLNALLAPGTYMLHQADGPFANMPADAIPSSAYWLEVSSYASPSGEVGQFVIQRLTRQSLVGASTPDAHILMWQRRVDRSAPGVSNHDRWVQVLGGASNPPGPISNPWVVACLGDSLTAGPRTGVDRSWVNGFAARLGCTAQNFGIGGSRATDGTGSSRDGLSFYELSRAISTGFFDDVIQAAEDLYNSDNNADYRSRIAAMAALDWSTVTHMTIFYGTNDFRGSSPAGVPIGTDTDTGASTFWGAINDGLDDLLTGQPHIRLALVTPLYRFDVSGLPGDSDTAVNGNGHTLQDYADVIRQAADARHLPVIDLNRTGGINSSNHAAFLSDGLHPWSVIGQEHMIGKMSSAFSSHF